MIPTYNQENFIVDAIESALNQDYPNLEIVISDDHSQDNTSELAAKYLIDKRIKYFRNDTNIGRVNNYRKTLFDYSMGDWVVNLDGDDYFTDIKFISRAIDYIKGAENLESNIVAYLANHCDLKKINKKLVIKKIDKHAVIIEGKQYFINYSKIGSFAHMACIYKREKAITANFYIDDFLATDFLSFVKLVLEGQIILADYNIGVWRKHKSNASQSNLFEKYKENIVVDEILASYASKSINPKEINKWLIRAKEKTKDDYVFDIVTNSTGTIQFKYLLLNFKLKLSYFVLFFSIFKKAILSNATIQNFNNQ